MPIQPPNFNVPVLSPAAVLGRRDRSNPLEGTFNQILNFALQSKLQERSAEAAAKRQEASNVASSERSFQRELAQGGWIRIDSDEEREKINALPGDVDFFQGPGRFSESVYAPSAQVAAAEEARELAQPAGEDFFEDVTRGNLVTPTGGSRSAEEINSLRRGDRDETIQSLQTAMKAASRAGLEDVAANLRNQIETVQQDERFTLSEEQRYSVDTETIQNYNEMAQARAQAREEDREKIAGFRQQASTQLQVNTGDGNRNLTAAEKEVYGHWRAGDPLNVLTAEDRAVVESLDLRPRTKAPDIVEDWRTAAGNANQTGTPEIGNFVDWLKVKMNNNPEVAKLVEEQAGGTSEYYIRQYAQNAASQEFRYVWALDQHGFERKSEILNVEAQGASLPFGKSGVFEKFQMVDPTFNDVGVDTNDSPSRGTTPLTGTEEEDLTSDVESRFQPRRDEMAQTISKNLQDNPQGVASGYRALVLNMLGNQQDVVQKMRATARNWRGVNEDEANFWEDAANNAENNWNEFVTYRDSVFIPAIRQAAKSQGVPILEELPR